MKNKLILIGGGGHCKACIDVIEAENKYIIQGILDQQNLVGQTVLGYNIIGTDSMIPSLAAQGLAFLVTVGQIKSAAVRKKIYDELLAQKAEVATIVSPKAYVSKHAEIGRGTIIMHGAYVNAGANLKENNIINTCAIIEHNVQLGSHNHISTNAVVNGNCMIGDQVFIGSNVVVNNGINIVGQVIVSSGSLLNKDVKQQGTYIGTPAIKYD